MTGLRLILGVAMIVVGGYAAFFGAVGLILAALPRFEWDTEESIFWPALKVTLGGLAVAGVGYWMHG